MRRITMGAVGALGLAGCAGLDLNGTPAPVERAALLGGAVGIAGPQGYCVDVADSSLLRGFAILAPCATLGVEGAGVATPAVITVQAGRMGTAAVAGSEPAFAGLLETSVGAALLSRSGSADTVDVLDTTSGSNNVTVYFADKEGTPIPGTQDREWRAFVDVNGRLVTISLRGLTAAPLDQSGGAALLQDAVVAIQGANAA